jgi:hypothetical protein
LPNGAAFSVRHASRAVSLLDVDKLFALNVGGVTETSLAARLQARGASAHALP